MSPGSVQAVPLCPHAPCPPVRCDSHLDLLLLLLRMVIWVEQLAGLTDVFPLVRARVSAAFCSYTLPTEAGTVGNDHPHGWLQRGDRGIQERQVQRLGK